MTARAVTTVVRPDDGVTHDLGGGLGARLLIAAGTSEDRCSLVDHSMAPRTLGSPVHTHAREDEYSQPQRDLGRRAHAPFHPADVQERLVDRHPSTIGAASSKALKTALLASE